MRTRRAAHLSHLSPHRRYQEAIAAPSWFGARAVQLGTIAAGMAFSQTWLHPLLKKIVPAQGEVGGRVGGRMGGRMGELSNRRCVMFLLGKRWMDVYFLKPNAGMEPCRSTPTVQRCGSLLARPSSAAFSLSCWTMQGPSRDNMLNGYFKNRVLAWSAEPAGTAPTLVQAEVGDPHRDGGYWGTSRMVRHDVWPCTCHAVHEGSIGGRGALRRAARPSACSC